MNFIHDICNKYNIDNYTINGDGSIDVNDSVNLSNYSLTELPLTFNIVTGDFDCSNNNLTRLKGCPRWIGGCFRCVFNRLSTLEFSPDYVGAFFNCSYNDLIDNYCETEIGQGFFTTMYQNGLIMNNYNNATNYDEWRKLHKRKLILNELYTRHM